MEKRYQVFLSSTYEDLKEERAKAIAALLNIDCFPCGMEYFPASDEEAWQCIERLIPQCDYYVIIIGGRYGSIPKGSTKSYTHKEYELAIKHRIPIIGLVHQSPESLAVSKSEKDPKTREKLDKFRAQVRRKLCRPWETSDQLVGQLTASLTKQIKSHPRPGWVNSESLANDAAKDEIIKLRRKIESHENTIKTLKRQETEQDDQLSSGDDPVLIHAKSWGYDPEEDYTASTDIQIRTTWNLLLRFMRLNFSGNWDDFSLKSTIQKSLSISLASVESIKFRHSCSIQVANSEIDKILAQFNALGIICRRGSNWDYTSKGLTIASRMMALRKGETHIGDITDWLQMTPTLVYGIQENPLVKMGRPSSGP